MENEKMKFDGLLALIADWDISYKIIFTERLLSQMTIMNRAIWNDPELDSDKIIEVFKWGNELAHRLWNILYDLKRGKEEDYLDNLKENLLFYAKQSYTLRIHLSPILRAAYRYTQSILIP